MIRGRGSISAAISRTVVGGEEYERGQRLEGREGEGEGRQGEEGRGVGSADRKLK